MDRHSTLNCTSAIETPIFILRFTDSMQTTHTGVKLRHSAKTLKTPIRLSLSNSKFIGGVSFHYLPYFVKSEDNLRAIMSAEVTDFILDFMPVRGTFGLSPAPQDYQSAHSIAI